MFAPGDLGDEKWQKSRLTPGASPGSPPCLGNPSADTAGMDLPWYGEVGASKPPLLLPCQGLEGACLIAFAWVPLSSAFSASAFPKVFGHPRKSRGQKGIKSGLAKLPLPSASLLFVGGHATLGMNPPQDADVLLSNSSMQKNIYIMLLTSYKPPTCAGSAP